MIYKTHIHMKNNQNLPISKQELKALKKLEKLLLKLKKDLETKVEEKKEQQSHIIFKGE
jgi:hypothetical protein